MLHNNSGTVSQSELTINEQLAQFGLEYLRGSNMPTKTTLKKMTRIDSLLDSIKYLTSELLSVGLGLPEPTIEATRAFHSQLRELQKYYPDLSEELTPDLVFANKKKWLYVVQHLVPSINLPPQHPLLICWQDLAGQLNDFAGAISTINSQSITPEKIAIVTAAEIMVPEKEVEEEVEKEIPVIEENPSPEKPPIEIKKAEVIAPPKEEIAPLPKKPITPKKQPSVQKQAITKLHALCNTYEKELKAIPNQKSKVMQQIVQELRTQIADKPKMDDETKLKNFASTLQKHNQSFSLSNDPETKKFVTYALKILATVLLSIPTLGFFAAACAIYGKSKHGNANHFWQKPETSRKRFVKDATKVAEKSTGYSINLMWINKTLDATKPYISNHESESVFTEKVLDKARKWKAANPEADVILWYDGHYVTDKALESTRTLLRKKAQKDPTFAFKLKDIREIDFVRQNPDALSNNLPIYYRIDLLKLIICVNSIQSDGMGSAIFSDLEVGDLRKDQGRMNKKELFNPEVMEKLSVLGIQVNADGIKDENQFIQVMNNPNTIQAMQVYINACVSCAITALNCKDQSRRNLSLLPDLTTSVFSQMAGQLFQLIEMSAYEKEALVRADLFESKPTKEWIKYDMTKHGHLPLGNFYRRDYDLCFYVRPGAEIKNENITPYNKLIKFQDPSENCEFSREDMMSRPGKGHLSEQTNSVLKPPADGSDTYKYHAWENQNNLVNSCSAPAKRQKK